MRQQWWLAAATALVGVVMYVPIVFIARLASCDPAPPGYCKDADLLGRIIVLVMVVFAGSIPALIALSAPWPTDRSLRALVVVLLLVVGILGTFLLVGVDARGCRRGVTVPGCLVEETAALAGRPTDPVDIQPESFVIGGRSGL